jgi:hypothetical protein
LNTSAKSRRSQSRAPEFYDHLVWERSPYTGVLLPPVRKVSKHTLVSEPRIIVDTNYIGEANRAGFGRTRSARGRAAVRGALAWRIVVACALVLGLTGWILSRTVSDPSGVEATVSPVRYNTKSSDITEKKTLSRVEGRVSSPVESRLIPETNVEDAPSKRNTEPSNGDVTDVPLPPVPDQVDMQQYHALLDQVKDNATKGQRIALLRDAIVLNPKGDEALARLSILLMESPKTREEALSLAERAAAANDKNAMAWLAIGYIAQMNGKSGEARAAYQRCAAAPGPMRYVRDCRSLM